MNGQKRTFGDWLFFPFKIYLLIAPIELYLWHQMTAGQRIRGGLAEGTGRVMLGYLICFVVFALTAIIRFITGRRELVAENLAMAGITFIIMYSLAPYAATS